MGNRAFKGLVLKYSACFRLPGKVKYIDAFFSFYLVIFPTSSHYQSVDGYVL